MSKQKTNDFIKAYNTGGEVVWIVRVFESGDFLVVDESGNLIWADYNSVPRICMDEILEIYNDCEWSFHNSRIK